MSRWLNKVGDFLEKLDDKAEKVVDERLMVVKGETEEEDATFENMRVASILAARGLDEAEEEEEEETDDKKEAAEERMPVMEPTNTSNENDSKEEGWGNLTEVSEADEVDAPISPMHTPAPQPETPVQEASADKEDSHTDIDPKEESLADGSQEDTMDKLIVATSTDGQNYEQTGTKIPAQNLATGTEPKVSPQSPTKPKIRQAQKEARTLRRQVLQLHTQLERAEAEIQAQREELDRAAERIEKDRARYKADKETAETRQKSELQVLKENHEKALKESKARSDVLLEETRQQLRDLEQRHVQEGGDWDKELGVAVEREQEMIQRIALLEDEKAISLSQISTLQAQQEALGSRLESLTETADNAMAREREAEDRLDETLSLHARQMSQRNSRETQLEQTVAELGAALVAARGKAKAAASAAGNQSAGDATSQEQLSRQEASLKQEIENLQGRLAHEQQRSETLQQELREVTRERTEEVSVVTTRQLEYDRRVSEMSREIAELRRQLRESKEISCSDPGDTTDNTRNQLKNLSEELLKQREAGVAYKSEMSALKSRLKVALHRAEQAEASAERAHTSTGAQDLERGSFPKRRKRRTGNGLQGSMKTALQAETSPALGSCLDVVDDSLGKTGSLLRGNPIARFIFVLYLLILHLWTFLLLMFHAHGSFESDYVGGVPHGPQALLLPHQMVPPNAVPDAPKPIAAVPGASSGK